MTNLLKNTRSYLIGHMEFSNGEGWRNKVKNDLKDRNIKFYDPYHKPFIDNIPEDNSSREEMFNWRETGQYDLVSARMKPVRGYDLRCCDLCDWFIAHIKPNIASWGSMEEITTINRSKKPIFLVIDDPKGKKATPLWFFGVIPHKYIYNNIDEVISTIKSIDDGIIHMSSDRWKLFREDVR